jgi:hypothetical protein
MNHVRFTLKRRYFAPILQREKLWEYRKKSDYYDKAFARDPKFVVFHSYKSDFILSRIAEIKVIRTPAFVPADCFETEYCYAIRLENPLYFKNRAELLKSTLSMVCLL